MEENRVILSETTEKYEAIELIKTLPVKTKYNNRHKFVFTNTKLLVIGKANIGNPRHRDLGNVKTDKIAGFICFVLEDDEVVEVYLNNESVSFNYPKFEFLKEPQIFITNLFGPVSIDMEDIPKPESKIIDLSSLTTH